MKRFLIGSWPAILLLFLIASCSKESSTEEDLGQYYVKCKIDGVDKTFNERSGAAIIDVGGGITSCSVIGFASADPNNMESLALSIQLYIPFATGTYKETDPTSDYFVGGVYSPNTVDPTLVFGNKLDEANPLEITYTEITGTTLSGTFKGKLFVNGADPKADSAIITNGQFKVKIQK